MITTHRFEQPLNQVLFTLLCSLSNPPSAATTMARVSVLLFATVAAVVLAAVVAGEPRVHPDQVRSQTQ